MIKVSGIILSILFVSLQDFLHVPETNSIAEILQRTMGNLFHFGLGNWCRGGVLGPTA